MNLQDFLNGYVTALLWSSTDDNDTTLDDGEYVLAPEARAKCEADCLAFMAVAASDLALYAEVGGFPMPSEYAGHDFWLTRAGHGAGFWDRGLDELGDRLTTLCKGFPNIEPYVGDDGLVHLS